MQTSRWYSIAETGVQLTFVSSNYHDGDAAEALLVPSLKPFRCSKEKACEEMLFSLRVDDGLPPIHKDKCQLIHTSNGGNGDIEVYTIDDGGYQFIIKDTSGKSSCLLITNDDFTDCACALKGDNALRSFGLGTALMLLTAFAGSSHNILLIHACAVARQGWGYAFIAKSGTGKSTQAANWLKEIEGTQLLNDDNPILRTMGGVPYIFGSPWSGKTPCYRNRKARLGGIAKIVHDDHNHMEALHPVEAFSYLLASSSGMMWDKNVHQADCDIVKRIVECTPMYNLYCLPDGESAKVCQKAISRPNK